MDGNEGLMMPKMLKESRRTRYTQTVLQDAVIELLAQKPVMKISVKELCERADINRSTFYAHYSGVEELLTDIEQSTLDMVREILAEVSTVTLRDDRNGVIRVLEEVCVYIQSNRNHLQVLMSPQADLGFQQDLIGLIYSFYGFTPGSALHGAEGAGTPTAGTNPAPDTQESLMRFHFAVSGSIGLIQYWLSTDLAASPSEVAATIYTMCLPSF